ncbi:MAG: 2-amino-4-hydroxy-6-hydroxymethyldihydropteridine diphosphokinase [Mariprofundus sp.]
MSISRHVRAHLENSQHIAIDNGGSRLIVHGNEQAHMHSNAHAQIQSDQQQLEFNGVFIALGGNIGDVKTHFICARNEIAGLEGTHLLASSLLYRSPPIGPAGQPDYLNAAIAINTILSPLELLDQLQAIEQLYGRERGEHWGPRTLDLDIIAIDSAIIDSERLIVPHPHMLARQFVLRPLCDLAPEWHHPLLGETLLSRLHQLLESGEKALPEGETW